MIEVSKTLLPGVLQVKRKVFKDHRGVYCEIYKKKDYFDAGITIEFPEDDHSTSRRGVLRGMHGDSKTWKLVSCSYGALYLVVLNYDETSSYFGRWESFFLTQDNGLQILIPPMHANGHLIISPEATFHYKQSEYYTDGSNQFVVKWDDPRFNIIWPTEKPILSERDSVGTAKQKRA